MATQVCIFTVFSILLHIRQTENEIKQARVQEVGFIYLNTGQVAGGVSSYNPILWQTTRNLNHVVQTDLLANQMNT